MIDFWGVGFDVAERMGLIPQLRRDSYDIQEVRFVNSSGRKVGGFDARVFRRALGEDKHQHQCGHLSAGIYRSLDGEVGTLFGDSISGIDQDEDDVCRLRACQTKAFQPL